jgi:hypothetical protein
MIIPLTVDDDIAYGLQSSREHRDINETLYLTTKSGVTISEVLNPLTSKYKDFLEAYIVTRELTEEQQYKYRYSPKKLSLDIYGTTGYWSMILFLNECHSIIDFAPTTVKYVDPKYIDALFDEIHILEDS